MCGFETVRLSPLPNRALVEQSADGFDNPLTGGEGDFFLWFLFHFSQNGGASVVKYATTLFVHRNCAISARQFLSAG
jgi:hypothetical protein